VLYNANVAVVFEIRTQNVNTLRTPCRNLNVKLGGAQSMGVKLGRLQRRRNVG